MRGAMAGITQKNCVALIPLWSLKKKFVFWEERYSRCQPTETQKKKLMFKFDKK